MTTQRNRTFAEVIGYLRFDDCLAYRGGWNGVQLDGDDSMYIALETTEDNSVLPYFSLTTPQGTQVPWLATSTDILADDWVIVYQA